jgi:hypothetical protein
MVFCIQAIIGAHQTLLRHGADFLHANVVPLAQGMAIIPLTDDLYREVGAGEEADFFFKLSTSVEQWAERISDNEAVAYIEAEFFGGSGDQSAVVWRDGARLLGPVHTGNAINEALSLLGALRNNPLDEFDSVGLGRHRDTAAWVEMERC